MSFEIAKAGWLYRQSNVLRRWKRNWFVLYVDGVIKYFDTPESHSAEEVKLMPAKCLLIKRATQVSGVTLPPGLAVECLLALVFSDETWTLCAESPDDMATWCIVLEDARTVRADAPSAPPPYRAVDPLPGYGYPYPPGQVYYGTHPPQYVVRDGVPGQTTVVYTDYPYYHRRRYDGTDVAMGVVAGAALGSMMWGPLLWW